MSRSTNSIFLESTPTATTATVRATAAALSRRDIGMLVVCDDGEPVVGVISKSDLVRHLSDDGSSADRLTLIMTREVVTCAPRDSLEAVCKMMLGRRLQNVPVLNDQARPLGVLDLRDALRALLQSEQYEEQLLINYVTGTGYR